jgi:hypothetical protein
MELINFNASKEFSARHRFLRLGRPRDGCEYVLVSLTVAFPATDTLGRPHLKAP